MKDKALTQAHDFLWSAENLLDKIVEEISEKIGQEEEVFIEISEEISDMRDKLLKHINYPKIEEFTIREIVEIIEYGIKDITDISELKEVERSITAVKNGRLEDYRHVIDWEIKKWYLNKLRQNM